MQIYVSADAGRSGDGTKQRPFRHIQDAARLALPGDEVIVAPGIYREHVDPVCAGTPDKRITYRSEVPGMAVITLNVIGDAATNVIVNFKEGVLDKKAYVDKDKKIA